MPDAWIRFCRRLVPEGLRAVAFDPAVADLAHDRAAALTNRQLGPRSPGLGGRLRVSVAVLALALECRRLDGATRLRQAATPRFKEMALMIWLRDLRRALGLLRRQPLFSLIAVAILALGIGANVAVFSFVNAYVLARLPVPQAGALVRVYVRNTRTAFDVISYPNYRDLRDGAAGVDLAVHVGTRVLVGADDAAEARSLDLVSGNYFRVMHLSPVLGRLIDTDDDGTEGAHPSAVLSETYWRARYNADPAIVGRTIRLNSMPFQVVGIVPASFRGASGAEPADLWAPVTMQQVLRPRSRTNTLENRGWGWLRMIGRLSPDTTIAGAQAGFDQVAADINRRSPSTKDPFAIGTAPARMLEERDRQALTPFVTITFAFTGILLLVTCANLAGVMQSRVVARRREMAIRQSLGASRGRLVSEWLAECGVLALFGGVAGVVVSRLALLGMIRFKPPADFAGQLDLSLPLDWRVLAFSAAVSLGLAALFGLFPALGAATLQPSAFLKDEAGTTTGGRRGSRLRRGSVLVQVAASVTMLIACGLLVMSLRNLQSYSAGFDTEGLALVSVDLARPRVPADQFTSYREAVLARVRALPAVASADVVSYLPLALGSDSVGFRIPGYTAPDGSRVVSIDDNIVGAAYFKTLGLTFVSGAPWDASGATPGVVVNETMAKKFWPGQTALGQPIELVDFGMLTVTGVVRDSAYYAIGEPPMPYVFLPAEVAKPPAYTIMARTAGPAAELLPSLRRAVAGVDARVTPFGATTFEDERQAPLYPRRLMAAAASVFGLVSLLLTGVGLYGVVSTGVGQRTREIGVRMALGARAGDVQASVLWDSLRMVALGSVAGLGGGYLLAGALGTWLFGVSAFDITLYLGAVVVLAALALVAAWVPSRRAARVDPVVALRG